MQKLLIVAHCPSPNVSLLTDAVRHGALEGAGPGLAIELLAPLAAAADDVLAADAVILGTTENFGYVSGALKDFLERIYYPCLDKTEGLPWALWVKAGQDGSGARSSVERIVTGLRWKLVQPPLVMTGSFQRRWLDDCHELGMTLAAGLGAGVF